MSGILAIAISIRTIMDISFKSAVHKLDFDSFQDIIPNIKKILLTPAIWFAVCLAIINLWFWLLILQDFDLSYAYPLFSICYILIMLLGKIIFHEHLDKYKITGICLIGASTLILLLG